MLKALRDVFDSFASPSRTDPGAAAPGLPLACAVLLVEVMRADPEISAPEREAVRQALQRRFTLGQDELQRLIGLAEDASRSASGFHQFTSELNEQLDQQAKGSIVQTMWEVAYADGRLDAHENHVISRVAGLLHVTHGEYIAAKLRAKEALGL